MMRGRITETLIADLQEMALFPGEGRARREERQAQGPAHQTRRPNTHTTTHGEGNDTEPRNTTNHRARDWSGVALQPLSEGTGGARCWNPTPNIFHNYYQCSTYDR
jgi:hypothetical protein